MLDLKRRGVLAIAGLLFAVVMALRIASENPHDFVTLLFTVPIALIAIELGLAWAFGAATFALALFGLWAAAWASAAPSALDYISRGVTFLAIGGVVGALAGRLRRVSAEADRFWELSSDLLCTSGLDGVFTRMNPAWEATVGWTEEELCSRPFIDFVHPDDRERTIAETASLAEGYRTVNFHNRYECKDGSYRHLMWSSVSVPADNIIYGIARDITATVAAQEERRSNERFLSSVLENLPNMVFVKDAEELRFVRLNHAGEELLGIPRDELIGKSDYDLFDADDADFFVKKDRQVLASGQLVDIPEETVETVAKGTRILHTRKIAIADEDGRSRYLLGISEDITDQHEDRRAAEAARAEAERANRAKSEFLSRMSHELRTPLNAVIGFGQLLELDDLDERQHEGVEQILKAGRHLLELINEVLDISRIESGTMSMSVEPVHLGSVLAEALSLIRPLADEAGVELKGDPSTINGLHVQADQQRLKQVLINLLSNAVKYNRRGGSVRVECSVPCVGHAEVAVIDTGRGMTGEQMERLFDPFDRLGAEAGDVEGTGLGLSLSIGLMKAMGGTIEADSEPGTGTTMRVLIDTAVEPEEEGPPANGAPRASERSAGERGTVVYVEDNLSNLKLVERALEHLPDIRLIPAMHGKLGIDLARQHRPNLILLDLHLPDLHGHEVLELLKADPATDSIPVVVVSADATRSQVSKLLAAGAAEYLTKPINVERLLDVVKDHVALQPAH
ncbi:MAG: PAS domain S-box protein [Thermoleophilaceae bacterium]|nr:PAS domain S-box protein [Thermoleophilaceae bacterium]